MPATLLGRFAKEPTELRRYAGALSRKYGRWPQRRSGSARPSPAPPASVGGAQSRLASPERLGPPIWEEEAVARPRGLWVTAGCGAFCRKERRRMGEAPRHRSPLGLGSRPEVTPSPVRSYASGGQGNVSRGWHPLSAITDCTSFGGTRDGRSMRFPNDSPPLNRINIFPLPRLTTSIRSPRGVTSVARHRRNVGVALSIYNWLHCRDRRPANR
jgi:hypothetical protein